MTAGIRRFEGKKARKEAIFRDMQQINSDRELRKLISQDTWFH